MGAFPRIIRGQRIVLRDARDHDLDALVDLQTDPEVRRYLGGPRNRVAVRAALKARGVAFATALPGSYVIADIGTDALVGTTMLERRASSRPGHLHPGGSEWELSYVLTRDNWGRGLAYEATSLLLVAAARAVPDEPVIVVTQTANARGRGLAERLGFSQVTTFSEFGEEQWLGVRTLSGHELDSAPQPRGGRY